MHTPSRLVEIAEPNVLLIGAKQADNGSGLVLRLWEVSGHATTTHVRLGEARPCRASACNLVEATQGSLEIQNDVVAVPVRGFGLSTVLVE